MSDNSISPKTTTDFGAVTQRTVMLIDDSEIDRAVYRRYLQADTTDQYTIVEAETGEAAFEDYTQYQPDLILLDYLLPDITGLEWLSQLQQQNTLICPAIALTGQGDENIAVQFIKIGATDYLVKGEMTAEKLKLAINKALHFRQMEQTNEDLIAQLTAQNQKLRHSNQLYRTEINKNKRLQEIITNVPVVVYAKDVDATTKQTGKLWLVNQEFQKIFALTEAEAIGKTDLQLFPSHIANNIAESDRLVIENKKPLSIGENVYHADGNLHTYLSLKFPLVNEVGQVTSIVNVANNISEIKQAQTQLFKSETKFRNTFEQATVGIAHVAIDGRWLRVNQKLCQIINYTKEELLLKTFQDITHRDDLNKDIEYVHQILNGKIQTYSIEKRYIRKNGSPIWIELTVSLVRDTNGQPDYFISVIKDIDDRKNLEFTLQKSLKRLSNLRQIDQAILAVAKPQEIAQTAIDNIQNLLPCQRISIFTFDWEQATATILATTDGSTKLLGNGFQVSLWVWQKLIDRWQHSHESDNFLTACLSQLSLPSQLEEFFKTNQLNNFIVFPFKSQGNLFGILKLWIEDIEAITTEDLIMVKEISGQIAIALVQASLYKQTQNYALELETRVAERTAQLEEINQQLKAFTYSISHDLKAPLRAIQGFATALQEDYADLLDDLGQEYTSRLIAAARQMTQLIEDLLAYSRLSRVEIQLQPIDLSTVVDLAIEQLKPEIERTQADINVDVEPLSTMMGNQTILVQIVSNLLANAIKFVSTSVCPRVSIRTENIIDNATDSSTKTIRLWVEDNGIGINPEHQQRIFQVFERLHGNEAYPGTGIGLAIVKKGIERLEGSFGVISESGNGSRFWIEGKN